MGWRTRLIDFGQGPRTAMAFPWGDVSTAYYTTGIKNVEVYVAAPPVLLWGARFGNLMTPLLSLGAVQTALKKRAGAIPGPSAQARATSPTFVWGEASDGIGESGRRRSNEPSAVRYAVQIFGLSGESSSGRS